MPYFNLKFDGELVSEITAYRLPEIPNFEDRNREDHEFLWKVCMACWAKKPSDRPTMSEIARMLRSHFKKEI